MVAVKMFDEKGRITEEGVAFLAADAVLVYRTMGPIRREGFLREFKKYGEFGVALAGFVKNYDKQ